MRTKSDMIKRLFYGITGRQRNIHGQELSFSKEEFILWLDEQPFDELFSIYLETGDKNLVPTIDRISDLDLLAYHFDNMQVLSFEDNRAKRRDQEKLAIVINGNWDRPVNKFTLDGKFIESYKTCRIAALANHSTKSAITAASCREARSGEFIWSHNDEVKPWVSPLGAVHQYSLEGDYIATYRDKLQALDETGVSVGFNKKSSGNFQWSRELHTGGIAPYKSGRKASVRLLNLEGEVLKEFKSVTKAAEFLNTSRTSVRNYIKSGSRLNGYYIKN